MNVTLRPDRNLLDANFESYKLSLEKIPLFNAPVPAGINFASLKSTLSKQHIKAYSSQNCLYTDPFHPDCLYYITSNGKVFYVKVPDNATNFNAGCNVCDVADWHSIPPERQLFASLKFPCKQRAIIYDGCRFISIYDTAMRGQLPVESAPWKHVAILRLPLESAEAVLLEVLSTKSEDGLHQEIHCIFASVDRRPEKLFLEPSKSSFVTYLDWVTFKDGSPEFTLSRHRKFAAGSFPDYVAFEQGASALHVCSERQFRAIFDSCNPAIEEASKESPVNSKPVPIASSSVGPVVSTHWSQTESASEDEAGSIVVSFHLAGTHLPPGNSISKQSVQITISPPVPVEGECQTLCVQLIPPKSGDDQSNTGTLVLLNQSLYGFVEADAVWSIDRETGILEVHLNKKHTLNWPRLLQDVIMDQRLIKSQESTVESNDGSQTDPSMTGDDPSLQNASLKPAFNVEQLEEVDFGLDQEDDDLNLQRFDRNTLKVTHQASLSGHQWLLNILSDQSANNPCSATSAFCIRHDVDGIVWLPCHLDENSNLLAIGSKKRTDKDDTLCPWRHMCTLQAFGYVLASKRDHRFVSGPLLSTVAPIPFVAVADASKRIYVYRQPLESSEFPNTGTELRRRKVAKTDASVQEGVVHVAWQHVVSLPESGEIIGFVAVSHPYPACIACTQNNLYLLSLAG